MKGRTVFILIFLIVLADQVLKFYIKTHFYIGQSHSFIGNWGKLWFVENEGMAYGWKFGGNFGKLFLTLFRLVAVLFGIWYLRKLVMEKQKAGFVICASLIFAGALGNLIDSMFYGLIFEESTPERVAAFLPLHGYAGFLHGRVVDMMYFPIIRNKHFPTWVPIWGGDEFEFFRPIFNLADASISTGVIAILVFQKKLFGHQKEENPHPIVETAALNNDEIQVQ